MPGSQPLRQKGDWPAPVIVRVAVAEVLLIPQISGSIFCALDIKPSAFAPSMISPGVITPLRRFVFFVVPSVRASRIKDKVRRNDSDSLPVYIPDLDNFC